jgi:acetyltransferase
MSLQTLFNPKSIAVIGASTKPTAIGHIIVKNLLSDHYPGKVFPVNPKAETLLGLPCYSAISAIQEAVELAIIVIPAAGVPEVLQSVAEKGIKAVIIISAGFKEGGVQGKVLEQQVKDIAMENGITLLGPNCLGFLHASRALNASFAKALPKPGNITFLSQSGALCTTILDETEDTLGYAHFVSIGNKATLEEAELLEYFITDPETHVIGLYAEDLKNSQALIELGKKALLQNPSKPLIILKSGTTEAGAGASSSHTGAVAGSDHAYDTLFREAFIHRAENLNGLITHLAVFSQNPLPAGNKLAIITNAGGMGVLATDKATKAGLTLAGLSDHTVQDLKLILPSAAGTHNPIDVLGDAPAERYALSLGLVAQDPEVDMILIIVTPQAMTEDVATAEAIIKFHTTYQKPLVVSFSKGAGLALGTALLKKAGIAVVPQPEDAALALASLAQTLEWKASLLASMQSQNPESLSRNPSVPPITKSDKSGYLSESETRHVLEQYGFVFPKTVTVTSESELAAHKEFLTGPVVLKILSPDILHKSDVGGVVLSVKPENIPEAYQVLLEHIHDTLPDAKIEGVLIAEMAPKAPFELILGLKEEPGLGKLVVIGMGGIYVEILHDVASRFAPVNTKEAKAMLAELKSFPLLMGTRGQKGVDIDALAEAVAALSQLAIDHPEIQELDINPLIPVEGNTLLALDARIRIREEK